MIARIWRTKVDPTRLEEYRRFALTRSLPIFRASRGFLGVLFVGAEDDRAVISLWDDAEAAAALDSSSSYRETVALISTAGFLVGDSSVETFEVEGGDLGPLRSRDLEPEL
jgi:heme-degrading monooxygenase HmoA